MLHGMMFEGIAKNMDNNNLTVIGGRFESSKPQLKNINLVELTFHRKSDNHGVIIFSIINRMMITKTSAAKIL